MTKTINMTEGKPLKLMFFFALPLMLGNVFQQLYTVTDTAIVGQGVGMDALAALGTVDWLNWMMLAVAQGISQGFCVRIAQKFGEGDGYGMKLFIGQSAKLAIILSICLMIVGHVGLPFFLIILQVPDELVGMSELYTRILFTGIPVTFFYNYCAAVLRAVGDSKTPLFAMVIAALTNIGLDLLFVFPFQWGIAGAAVATVIAQCVAGFICVTKIVRTPELHFGKEHMGKNPAIIKNLLKIGMPGAVKYIIISLGGMAVQSIVNGFGTTFIAGFTAANKLYGILEIAAISYGNAVTTYVGQNYGATEYKRIKKGMGAAVILALITSVVIAIIMFVFGRPITMLFISTETPELAVIAGDIAYTYLCIMSTFLPVLYMIHIFQAGIEGVGNTVTPMLSGGFECIIRIVFAAVIGFTGYQMGIFGAEIAAWIGAAIFLSTNYYVGVHKKLLTEKK